MPQAEKARVFRNGRSQAVRIPVEFRFKTDEVYIRQNPTTGDITLSERPMQPTIEEVFAMLDAAGAKGLLAERDKSPSIDRELF